jgi:arginyl-tRNA synthetase
MKIDFKKEITGFIADAIRSTYAAKLSDIFNALKIDDEGLNGYIHSKLEMPKDRKMGDYAFPTFLLAKALQAKPADIAIKIVSRLEKDVMQLFGDAGENCCTVAGPYINIMLPTSKVAEVILPEIHDLKDHYGDQTFGQGKKIVIDFSSPNIAKPFGVAHLRTTIIGNSLYRIFEKLGYESVGINHLGDWGTQFGKMIVAFRKWGDEEKLDEHSVNYLYDLYVKFHAEEEKDPSLTEEARGWFKKLEEGDAEAVALWKKFKHFSLHEFKRIYDILGVKFDYYTGESFYNDKMQEVIDRLTDAGLAVKSQGALVVDLEQYGMTACMLEKADGATLYSTRDLAAIFYRHRTFNFHKALYVVSTSQREHFRQVFKVVDLLGEKYADRLVHIEFGWIKFQDKAMKTREGNIILLEDVIETATEKAEQVISEKNPDLPEMTATARMIGLGAIIFAQLGVRKHKDVNFSWEEVLNFEGETGPYLQYTHARLSALMRKYKKQISAKVDFALFDSPEEKALLIHLYRFGQVVEQSSDKYEPNIISEYLLELAAIFNRFYQRKDSEGKLIKIISENKVETRARMLLVASVRIVMKEGMRLLGIEAPVEM